MAASTRFARSSARPWLLLTAAVASVSVACRRAEAPKRETAQPIGADTEIWPVAYGMVILGEDKGASIVGTPRLLWGGDDHDESFFAAVDAPTLRPDVPNLRGPIEITTTDGRRCAASVGEGLRLMAWAFPPSSAGWWEKLDREAPELATEVFSCGRRYWIKQAGECQGFGWATRPGVRPTYVPGVKVEAASSDAGWQHSWSLRSGAVELTATCFVYLSEGPEPGGQPFERSGMRVQDAAGKLLPSDWTPALPDESCSDVGLLLRDGAQPIITFSTNRGFGALRFDGRKLTVIERLSAGGR